MRRTGLAPGTEDERDPEQVRLAIEGVRAHMPLVESVAPQQATQIRDALSQMQLAYLKIGGSEPASTPTATPTATPTPAAAPTDDPPGGQVPPAPEPEQPQPGEPGPAQRSGRLWIPGQ
jgi:hypothetical protein